MRGWEDVRAARGWVARGMGWVGDLAGLAILCVTVTVALRLWGASEAFVQRAGGLPPNPALWGCAPGDWSGCQAYAAAMWPGLHLRLAWWSAAWACAVLAGGAGLLSLAGLRWAYWRARSLVAS